MNPIAANIRALRLKHQMTQAQLAAALGVQYQTVSKWETGTTTPDTTMLPQLADLFKISIDALFGRKHTSCSADIPSDNVQFLLHTYAQMYDPEAGPWNLSVANKYLEYKFADFFETHFAISRGANICNIGIGAGEWDLYLSYKLKGGSLTSIDKAEVCCKQLEQRLICEGNPNEVRVICSDVMELDFSGQFDIVTMVGSTVVEGGIGLALLEKAMRLVKVGGAIYYQSLDERENCNTVVQTAYRQGMDLEAIVEDNAYGFCCHYYKFSRNSPPN